MKRQPLVILGLCITVILPLSRSLLAAEVDLKKADFFEKRIRPLLINRCYECHSEDSVESGLRVDSLSALVKGGERGASVVIGKPEQSLLISAVNHSGQLHMPPKDKLSQKEISDLTEWIRLGAYWPNSKPITQTDEGKLEGPLFTEQEKAFWAFQRVQKPDLPQVKKTDWVRNPIDAFVLSKLEQKGYAPAPPAEKEKLIRRATFDLIGLPPTQKEIDDFVKDDSPDAFARVIDRLLESPRYGERWGRHWLDVSRYADSNGLDENLSYANAFRFRDYVISAFNQDKPFDQFVQEQLAGDILADQANDDSRIEKITATGFLSIGAKMLAEDDQTKMQMDIIDEQLDTVGRTFMGLTLGCSRCHSHKFDPIPIEDYYSLAGIFKSTKTMENFTVVARWQERTLASPEQIQVLEQHKKQIADLDAQIQAVVKQADEQFLTQERKRVSDYLLAAEIKKHADQLMQGAKPIGETLKSDSSDSVFILEAENYQKGNVIKSLTGYGEGIGVIYNNGMLPNIAEYEIELPEAGRYQFEIRYAAAAARPVQLLINDQLVKNNAAGEVTGSWNPKSQPWEVEGFYQFSKGKNKIRLESKIPFPHIDKLLIAVPRETSETEQNFIAGVAAHESQLVVSLTTQWADFLSKAAEEKTSPFFVWNELVRTGKTPNDVGPLYQRFQSLNELPVAQRLPRAAQLYGTLFAEIEQEWQAFLKTEAGKNAKSLPDVERGAIRNVLYDPQGPFALPADRETYYAAAEKT
ncbi:MAG: DUF1549 domain-containing protein, partial [Planctomycetaceae bacterium]|nr:DUF1549 domain-containing protein [Planctomycetaceae bacterium]